MECKRRKIAQACIIDCKGIGNGIAIMPLKKAVADAIAAGERLFLVNLAAVHAVDRPFVQGLNAAKLLADRAEGALVVYGVNANTAAFFERYSDTLRPYDSQEEALKQLVPTSHVRDDLFRIAVLGEDKFQSAAFQGVSHYKNRGVFHFHSHPLVDLKEIASIKPLIVFMNVNLGAAELRHLRRRIIEESAAAYPTFFFAFGTPKEQNAVRTAVSQAQFDDGFLIPFNGDIVLPALDQPAFKTLMAAKIEAVLDGHYLEQRKHRKDFGPP